MVRVHFRVRLIPGRLLYEVYIQSPDMKEPLVFTAKRRSLSRFTRDLQEKQNCQLKGTEGEVFSIQGSNEQSFRIAEYIELVLEGT